MSVKAFSRATAMVIMTKHCSGTVAKHKKGHMTRHDLLWAMKVMRSPVKIKPVKEISDVLSPVVEL